MCKHRRRSQAKEAAGADKYRHASMCQRANEAHSGAGVARRGARRAASQRLARPSARAEPAARALLCPSPGLLRPSPAACARPPSQPGHDQKIPGACSSWPAAASAHVASNAHARPRPAPTSTANTQLRKAQLTPARASRCQRATAKSLLCMCMPATRDKQGPCTPGHAQAPGQPAARAPCAAARPAAAPRPAPRPAARVRR